jgi:hypothetical protein
VYLEEMPTTDDFIGACRITIQEENDKFVQSVTSSVIEDFITTIKRILREDKSYRDYVSYRYLHKNDMKIQAPFHLDPFPHPNKYNFKRVTVCKLYDSICVNVARELEKKCNDAQFNVSWVYKASIPPHLSSYEDIHITITVQWPAAAKDIKIEGSDDSASSNQEK